MSALNPLIASYPLRPVNVIEILFFALCVYGIILLWSKPRIRALCLLLFFEALLMVFNFSEETGLFKQSILITPVFTLCTGPAFYLFVKHLTVNETPWSKVDFIHFAPASFGLFFTAHSQYVIAAGSLSLLIYGILSYQRILSYNAASSEMSSAALDMRLSWLNWIMLVFALLGLTDLIRLNLQPLLPYELMNSWYAIHQLSVFCLYATLIFHALKQPLLFDSLQEYETSLKKPLPDDLDRAIFNQINDQIISLSLFRKPRLSLHDIALHTGLNIRDISAAINKGSGVNFCEYINRLRVTEVKKYLSTHGTKKCSLLEIATNSGFNSKSSFNAAFKNEVGLTPTQFLSTKG